eukprot:CAMPEP_0198144284 /NCGR_PEP_ID=MMETSP1443-20131203/14352_1 /TAXON_ID=186043 /ORGANISM="Entomoneis sp., Strain CCMP2396" /LENGTH=41 /DNA_ID= /DNA_START= /DNA_END= /DNA_ORIENTATION=
MSTKKKVHTQEKNGLDYREDHLEMLSYLFDLERKITQGVDL